MGMGWEEDWDDDFLGQQYANENYLLWHDKEGNSHEVSKMATSHIQNILRMIQQNRFNNVWMQDHSEDWQEIFETELERRG